MLKIPKMLGIPIIQPKSSSRRSKRSSTNQTPKRHMCYLGSKGFPMYTTVRTSLPVGVFKVRRCDIGKLRTCQVFHLPVLGGLACCDSWGRKESDTTERLNWTEPQRYVEPVYGPVTAQGTTSQTPRTMEGTNTSTEHPSSTQHTARQRDTQWFWTWRHKPG